MKYLFLVRRFLICFGISAAAIIFASCNNENKETKGPEDTSVNKDITDPPVSPDPSVEPMVTHAEAVVSGVEPRHLGARRGVVEQGARADVGAVDATRRGVGIEHHVRHGVFRLHVSGAQTVDPAHRVDVAGRRFTDLLDDLEVVLTVGQQVR